MKRLFTFDVKKETGDKETVKYFLRKPTRRMFDEAEMFYGIEYSKGVKAGLLTNAQLSTKFADEGETLSKEEKEEAFKNYVLMGEQQKDLQELDTKKRKTKEDKDKISALKISLVETTRNIQKFEQSQQNLFNHTAESRARNRTALWWLFELAYLDDEEKRFFVSEDFEERLEEYDEMEEKEDESQLQVVKKFLYIVSLWYTGRAEKEEDFEALMDLIEAEGKEALTGTETKTEEEETKDFEDEKIEPLTEPEKETIKAEALEPEAAS